MTLRLLSTSDAILESSDGTRVICIELVRVGGGLERTVSVALNFIEEGYATRSKSSAPPPKMYPEISPSLGA